jgi:hypothetical protein
MRLRKDPFRRTDTQYGLQKRFIVPYQVVNGTQIYQDTLHKKWFFFISGTKRKVERNFGRLAVLLKDLAYVQAVVTPTASMRR